MRGLPYKAMKRDVVAVIGTTGVGKSQLAVTLAEHVRRASSGALKDAVILSSDSMQLYEGLPLITNKVTEDEAAGIEHWGIDVVRPGEGGPWEVGKWCLEASKKVRLK
jgi:tRNA dimethylallyltransferase